MTTLINRNGVARRDPIQVMAASGAIAITQGIVFITLGSAAAITLAAPVADGQRLTIVSTTAFAHTVTQTTPGFNGNGAASDVATFGAALGTTMNLVSYNGRWWTVGNFGTVTIA